LSLWSSYKLRWERRRWRLRARLRMRDLRPVRRRPIPSGADAVLVFCTLRNERPRLPFFLRYYRDLGAAHFLIVDNGSEDGSADYLAEQPDVSLWRTDASYRRAAFGMDWMNALLGRYAIGRWALTVDVDEFLVYPFCDTRPLSALAGWLADAGVRAFGALLLDVYPKGPVAQAICGEGDNPLELACWFDSANYTISRNPRLRNLWVQGGPRARAFFADRPHEAPALNKIPLVRWQRGMAYVSSTHMLLPRGLNLVYEIHGGEKATGCLMHAKFLATLGAKAREELQRGEHYAASREYRAYAEGLEGRTDLWHVWSERFINWRQLEILGLMSKGSWA
jgi:hypothetical protein